MSQNNFFRKMYASGADANTGVSSPCKNTPTVICMVASITRHDCWKFTVVITLCAQLTCDVLAIAKFLAIIRTVTEVSAESLEMLIGVKTSRRETDRCLFI